MKTAFKVILYQSILKEMIFYILIPIFPNKLIRMRGIKVAYIGDMRVLLGDEFSHVALDPNCVSL